MYVGVGVGCRALLSCYTQGQDARNPKKKKKKKKKNTSVLYAAWAEAEKKKKKKKKKKRLGGKEGLPTPPFEMG